MKTIFNGQSTKISGKLGFDVALETLRILELNSIEDLDLSKDRLALTQIVYKKRLEINH